MENFSYGNFRKKNRTFRKLFIHFPYFHQLYWKKFYELRALNESWWIKYFIRMFLSFFFMLFHWGSRIFYYEIRQFYYYCLMNYRWYEYKSEAKSRDPWPSLVIEKFYIISVQALLLLRSITRMILQITVKCVTEKQARIKDIF